MPIDLSGQTIFPYAALNELSAVMTQIYAAKVETMFQMIQRELPKTKTNGVVKKAEGVEYDDKEDNPNYDAGEEMTEELTSDQTKEMDEKDEDDDDDESSED